MRLFSGLLALAAAIMVGILLWDLFQERVAYPDKKLIIYAGMFGPGEPMQVLYAGPSPATVPPRPFGAGEADHYHALAAAWPDHKAAVVRQYVNAHGGAFPLVAPDPSPKVKALTAEFGRLTPDYVRRLVDALGESDRDNRLKLFDAFAEQPKYDPDSETYDLEADKWLILDFERLHPAYEIGLFEDFERRHPDHKIIQRWDGRWVLSSNRPRFLTGSDVPDLITGATAELRILMRENLATPLDRPLPEADKAAWRERGILRGETAYDDPSRTFESDIYEWALKQSTYTITEEDRQESGNPFDLDEKVLYFLPRQVHTSVVFYNKSHFRLIGRDADTPPATVAEFEEICRKILAAGKEPIAQDGAVYIENWWDWMVYRRIGYDNFLGTILDKKGAGRFAGERADPRYLDIARRLRKWRDDGFWMKKFSSSQWPGAQRDFGNGRCTFLFTGSWLPTEIASTRSMDNDVFELGCFFFPKAAGGAGRPGAMQVSPQGFCLNRQGKGTEGAVLLLRYLTARGGLLLSKKLNYISTTKGVPFPEALSDIEPVMAAAGADDFMDNTPGWFAPKFAKFVLSETYAKYFVVRGDNLSPTQFVDMLERRAQEHYQRFGGAR